MHPLAVTGQNQPSLDDQYVASSDTGVAAGSDFQFASMSGSSHAFTLVELVAVMAIMGVIAILVIPSAGHILGGNELARATDLVFGQLAQARQIAIAKNRNVEVRFYRFSQANEDRYRAFQAFVAAEDPGIPWQPLGKMQSLPQQICFDSGPALSPLIASSTSVDGAQTTPPVKLPGITNYKLVKLTFRPDGSSLLDKPATSTFLTLKDARLPENAQQLPANYGLIQLSTSTGILRVFRP